MSRKGNCWDNAPQESFFGHMKEEVHLNLSDSHQDIVRKVDDWIDYFNNERGQWNLAKLAPCEFYAYAQTGVYPLPVGVLGESKIRWGDIGAPPQKPNATCGRNEFIALFSGEGVEMEGIEKDDAS